MKKLRLLLLAPVAALFVSAAAPPAPLPFALTAPRGFTVDTVSTRVRGARFIAAAPNGDVVVSLMGSGQVVAVHPGDAPDAAPTVVASGLQLPNGVVFKGNDLYIATWTGVVVIRDYPRGISSPQRLFSDMLRNGGHNARSIAVADDGSIFVSTGSDCNVCRENDPRLATIQRYDAGGTLQGTWAKGLRNASGMAIDASGRLWAVVNQRDNLSPSHTDLPPDELDLIVQGGDYGWPLCYPDGSKRLPNPEFPGAACGAVLPTTANFQAHSAPLQASFYAAAGQGGAPRPGAFPAKYDGALFVAFHGSWNRDPPTGYKVVAVLIKNGEVAGMEDFITGWLTGSNQVRGRPVGVAEAPDGSLYVSDDTGYLFHVRYSGPAGG